MIDEERSEASANYEGTLNRSSSVAATNCQKLSEVAVEVKPQSSHVKGVLDGLPAVAIKPPTLILDELCNNNKYFTLNSYPAKIAF